MAFKRSNLRQRRQAESSSSDSDNDEAVEESSGLAPPSTCTVAIGDKLAAIRDLQKLRHRPAGMTLQSLAVGKPVAATKADMAEDDADDPFKMKTGGMVDMKAMLKRKAATAMLDEGEETISKLFAAETNRRDEDADMLKYIEEELSLRRGHKKEDSTAAQSDSSNPRDVLSKVPENLRPAIGKAQEGMMSQQMLSGIPEVDLGVVAKMRNIEATEEAKQRLVKERMENAKRQGGSMIDMVPVNVAVNFVQHARWNNQAENTARRDAVKKAQAEAVAVAEEEKIKTTWRVGDYEKVASVETEKRKLEAEKSSDGYHLQKFKQHMYNRMK